MGIKEDLPRVQYAVLRLGKGRARDLHLLRSCLDAGTAFEITTDQACHFEELSPTPHSVAIMALPVPHAILGPQGACCLNT